MLSDTASMLTASANCAVAANNGAAGTYAITCSGAAAPNYSTRYVSGTLIINPTPLTDTPTDTPTDPPTDPPTDTPTDTPTDIPTVTAVHTFPTTAVRDSFNRTNGAVGSNWDGLTGSRFYTIANNTVDVQISGPLVWKTSFGTSQEVFVSLSTIDPRSPSQGVLLKVQDGRRMEAGALTVVYDAKAQVVRVSALRVGARSWIFYPTQAATFVNGDVLGARATADGTVAVYQNGTLVTTMTLNSADQQFFNAKGGRIGIWTAAAPNAVLDDFGGGSVTP